VDRGYHTAFHFSELSWSSFREKELSSRLRPFSREVSQIKAAFAK
jgi:hypothetical protein